MEYKLTLILTVRIAITVQSGSKSGGSLLPLSTMCVLFVLLIVDGIAKPLFFLISAAAAFPQKMSFSR